MKNSIDRVYHALELQLAQLSLNAPNSLKQHSGSVIACRKAMRILKGLVSDQGFLNMDEEVLFFKQEKPRFYSQYIYHINLYNYHLQKPAGGEEVQRAYIATHLYELKSFFDRNQAFYQYYRSGVTQMDHLYFTRSPQDIYTELQDFQEDPGFSTSHDYKVSKIIANEKYQEFLNKQLASLGNEEQFLNGQSIFPFKHPQWTAGQTDAIELLYALKNSCAVNHGNIDIAELVAIFEFIFQTEFHESYHKLLDITRRKKDMFVFLTRLRNSIENFVMEKFS